MSFEDDAVMIDWGFSFDETAFLTKELAQIREILALKSTSTTSTTLQQFLDQINTQIDQHKAKTAKKSHILFTEDDKYVESINQRLLVHKQRLELFIANKDGLKRSEQSPIAPAESPTVEPIIKIEEKIVKVPVEKIVEVEKIVQDPALTQRCATLEDELLTKDAALAQLLAEMAQLKHALTSAQQSRQDGVKIATTEPHQDETQHPSDNNGETGEEVFAEARDESDNNGDDNEPGEGDFDDQGRPVGPDYWEKRGKYRTAKLAPEYNMFQAKYIEDLMTEVERLTAENKSQSSQLMVAEADKMYFETLSNQKQLEIDQWNQYANLQDFQTKQLQGEITQLTLILLEQAKIPRKFQDDSSTTTTTTTTIDVELKTSSKVDFIPEVTAADTAEPSRESLNAEIDADLFASITTPVEHVQTTDSEERPVDQGETPEVISVDLSEADIPGESAETPAVAIQAPITPISTPNPPPTQEEPTKVAWDEELFLQNEITFRTSNDAESLNKQTVELKDELQRYYSNIVEHGEAYFQPKDVRKAQRMHLHLARLTAVQTVGPIALSSVPAITPQEQEQEQEQGEARTEPQAEAVNLSSSSQIDADVEKEKYLNTAREVIELSKEMLSQAQLEAETLRSQVSGQDAELVQLRDALSTEESERRRLVDELREEREIKRNYKKQIERLQEDHTNLVERNAGLVEKYEYCLINHSRVPQDE